MTKSWKIDSNDANLKLVDEFNINPQKLEAYVNEKVNGLAGAATSVKMKPSCSAADIKFVYK